MKITNDFIQGVLFTVAIISFGILIHYRFALGYEGWLVVGLISFAIFIALVSFENL